MSTPNLDEAKAEAAEHDAHVAPRLEYMYSHWDFHHERAKARERFAQSINQKSTLRDIGGLLDRFTLDSKARVAEYFDPARHVHEQAPAATQDLD